MIAVEATLLNRLLNRAPVLRLREVVFSAACRLHNVWLNGIRPDRAQLRTLLGLVHRARNTPFGRNHDFSRIRSHEDYRRLVPLRTPAGLMRENASVRPDALLACHRRALRSAFALLHAASPATRPLAGRMMLVGDGIRPAQVPALLRPSLVAPPDAPSGCLLGPANRLAACLEHRPANDPAAVLFTSAGPDEGSHLRQLASPRPTIELLARPEAPIAVEDVHIGGLRLLVDHGVYFEFVPAGCGDLHPPRLGINEVRVGATYELAVTSPGGWWACRSGLFVCFERLSPPVLRVVSAPVVAEVPVTSQAFHPRSAGTAAEHQETSVHSPWSVPVDRG